MDRHPLNPILTRNDIPDIPPAIVDPTSLFNPGAVKVGNRYQLLVRVQNRGRETFILPADSSDGVKFTIRNTFMNLPGLDDLEEKVYHVYDPRITQLEDSIFVMVAMDMGQGCRLGLIRTDDFVDYEFMGVVSQNEVRNGVLFPEKIGGRYLRLDRPNQVSYDGGVTSGSEIVLSESDDLLHWQVVKPVMSGRLHYWDELIGSGPPPVKTRQGWLHLYHGIARHLESVFIYQVGVVLLDLDDPGIVLRRGRYNILEPRELYELTGQVPNVVFPGGMIVEEMDADGFALMESEVKIYYGAADTVIGLATTTIARLLAACHDPGEENR
jgi:beta-1,4-mannooligosaccharide/beta-1,4-mannosyl-N-acetylglucosamine phosphorylase